LAGRLASQKTQSQSLSLSQGGEEGGGEGQEEAKEVVVGGRKVKVKKGQRRKKGGLDEDDGGEGTTAKRSRHGAGSGGVLSEFLSQADLKNVEQTSSIFSGLKTICVSSPSDAASLKLKAETERKIAEAGGQVTQSPVPNDTQCIVSVGDHRRNSRLMIMIDGFKKMSRTGKNYMISDVLKVEWIDESIRRGTVIPIKNKYCLYKSPKTAEELKDEVDEFGDPFFDDTDYVELKEVFEVMSVPPADADADADADAADMEVDDGEAFSLRTLVSNLDDDEVTEELMLLPCLMLYQCVAYIDYPTQRIREGKRDISLDIAAQLIKNYGGSVSRDLTHAVTHIILPRKVLTGDSSSDRINELQDIAVRLREARKPLLRRWLVTDEWVHACVKQDHIAAEQDYAVQSPSGRDVM